MQSIERLRIAGKKKSHNLRVRFFSCGGSDLVKTPSAIDRVRSPGDVR
jgi:hypothetical protein